MTKIRFYQIKHHTFSDEYVRKIYLHFAYDSDLNELLSFYKIQDQSLLEDIMLFSKVATPELYVLLKHQKLSVQFIKKYILNPDWQTTDSEKNITTDDVLYYQHYDESLFYNIIRIIFYFQ